MIIDGQNLFSDAQALTASAASTNLIDLISANKLGTGEPMAVVITVDVAADGTTTNETYAFKLETDDNAAFSSATLVAGTSLTVTYGNLTAGSQHVIVIPPGASVEQYLRLYATLGGTTPSVTITATLVPMKSIANLDLYPDNVTIS